MNALTPVIPAGAQKNRLRPFGGRKVHWTFLCFRLTSRREREFFSNLLGKSIGESSVGRIQGRRDLGADRANTCHTGETHRHRGSSSRHPLIRQGLSLLIFSLFLPEREYRVVDCE
jgi:hypothetical protein